MQISPLSQNQYKTLNFKGFKTLNKPSLVILDLDRALAYSSPECSAKISELLKSLKAKVAYLTQKTFKNSAELLDFFKARSINLPTADFLIGDSCDDVRSNFGSVYLGNYDFKEKIRTKTNYNASWVNNIVHSLIDIGKYTYNQNEIRKLESLENFFELRVKDRDFAYAKISPRKSQDEFRNEFFISPDVDPYSFADEIIKLLNKRGIKAVYKIAKYPDKFIQKMDTDAKLKAHKLRRNPDNSITSVIFSPMGKGDVIRQLRDSLSISPEEVFIASTDKKDIGLAKLARDSAMFVCLKNAKPALKNYCTENPHDNIYISKESGSEGILEGLEYFKASSDLPF